MLDRLPALIASVALLILSLAAFAAATSPARAQSLGPAFSGGDFPLLSWSGTNQAYNQSITLYTVPAGKKLVVRTFCMNSSNWRMGRNGTVIMDFNMTEYPSNDDSQGLFCSGRGQAVFDAGDVLSIETNSTSTSTGAAYHVEGQLYAE